MATKFGENKVVAMSVTLRHVDNTKNKSLSKFDGNRTRNGEIMAWRRNLAVAMNVTLRHVDNTKNKSLSKFDGNRTRNGEIMAWRRNLAVAMNVTLRHVDNTQKKSVEGGAVSRPKKGVSRAHDEDVAPSCSTRAGPHLRPEAQGGSTSTDRESPAHGARLTLALRGGSAPVNRPPLRLRTREPGRPQGECKLKSPVTQGLEVESPSHLPSATRTFGKPRRLPTRVAPPDHPSNGKRVGAVGQTTGGPDSPERQGGPGARLQWGAHPGRRPSPTSASRRLTKISGAAPFIPSGGR
ncbi:hypothetical protein Fcan01_18555 [Folsomia candida]|uniref:Uncharacterized protein n=1 Tax=Folsomia candida TaxID=158441 RepID=A0A226DPC2_FOLCA|nr:hypothetical protein Fcan01_18555 [Folsomia candida]